MARFLGIDWDHDYMYLVSGSEHKKQVRVEKALVWQEPHTLETAQAEKAGERLRERLKEARIHPAPVVASLGRERVIFKELRYPNVDEGQEAGLIQFQATKELTEPPNRLLIDYTRLLTNGQNGNGSENRAIVSVVRREWLQSIQAMCQAAGLNLICLTPRPFGIAGCLDRSAASSAAPMPFKDSSVGILTVSRRWAEFCIVRNGQVRLARPLPLSDHMLEEVRRNLTLYANQTQNAQVSDSVQALYFIGDNEQATLLEKLKQTLAIPVHALDPFSAEEQVLVSGDRGGFAGIVGVGHLWAAKATPVNFVAPKEPKPEKEDNRRLHVLAACLGVVMLVGAFIIGMMELDKKRKQVSAQKAEILKLGVELKKLEPVKEKLTTLKTWDKAAVSWIHEIHKLTRRFPAKEEKFRVTNFSTHPAGAASSDYSMQMTIVGEVPGDRTSLVREWVDDLDSDPLWQAKTDYIKPASKSESQSGLHIFSISVDVAKEMPAENAAPKKIFSVRPKTGTKKFGSLNKAPG